MTALSESFSLMISTFLLFSQIEKLILDIFIDLIKYVILSSPHSPVGAIVEEEDPTGYTVFIPSTIVAHSNVPIHLTSSVICVHKTVLQVF